MQEASKAYKDSMNKPFRNRAYIRASIGVINSNAQYNASVDYSENNLLYFSNLKKPFDGVKVEKIYATAEENFTMLDGSMYFAPRENLESAYYNNGIVTKEILGSIYIGFQGLVGLNIKGLTIDFGECYPTEFTIENDSGIHVYVDNNTRYFSTDDSFDGTSYLVISPAKMVNGQGRMRIYKITCGNVNVFTNTDTISYTQKEYVSPITETIPSTDMELTVDNQSQYYSPDNAESTLAYFEVGQEVKVAFGYDVFGDGEIEWLPEVTCYLKKWSATDTVAKFTAVDRFGDMTTKYYLGVYRKDGISLYDLAVDVLKDFGITDEEEYFIDPYLKNVVVYNPMPPVTHGEALQIIANAGRCVLYEDRQSRIHMQSSFVPGMEVESNGETKYSNVKNILNDKEKVAYAIASNNFSSLDESLRFMPENNQYLYTGYISESIWVESDGKTVNRSVPFRLGGIDFTSSNNGHWTKGMPKLTINLEAAFVAYGFLIKFKNTAPRDFVITTHYKEEVVNIVNVTNNELLEYINRDRFGLFDKVEIEFTRGYPNGRVAIDSILINDITDYTLHRNESLTSSPTATRQNRVKSINVKRTIYKKNTSELKEIASEDITVPTGELEYTVYFSVPYTDLELVIDEMDGVSARIIHSSNYAATILFENENAVNKEIKFTVTGNEYNLNEQWYVKKYNETGEVKEWGNPLISTLDHAKSLEEWLSTHFLGDVEYQIQWRGDPRTDANDLFYLELKRNEKTLIRGYENNINYDGSWSGTMKARKAVVSWRG